MMKSRLFLTVAASLALLTASSSFAADTAGRKVLYYRNPMGLPDTSPVPKKDSMGMDYLPVFADQMQDDPGTVSVSPAKIQRLGVRTEAVAKRSLARSVTVPGLVQFDERRQGVVTSRFEGWVETLRVNATGETVKPGDVVMDLYSPEVEQAERDYAAVRKLPGGMAEAALQRMKTMGVPDDELARLRREGAPHRTIPLRSPVGGTVIEKMAFDGMRVMPGEALYKVTDLSTVWVIADVPEQDLSAAEPGQPVKVAFKAYAGKSYEGKVDFVYPTLKAETRTASVRIVLPNPDGRLKADMYASVEMSAPGEGDMLAVPESAVIDSGVRQVVLVEKGEGRFEPRAVTVGDRSGGYVAVTSGVSEGEKVVTSATFLIDAESNIQAALRAFTSPEAQK